MKWFLMALKKYADFNGRARRKEYWYFVLFFYIIYAASAFVGLAVNFPLLPGVVFLGMLIPILAVNARRMHDTDRSAWYMFVPLYSLILACTNGTPGGNQYGDDPKEPALQSEIDLIGNN